jgi:hypothetical protein
MIHGLSSVQEICFRPHISDDNHSVDRFFRWLRSEKLGNLGFGRLSLTVTTPLGLVETAERQIWALPKLQLRVTPSPRIAAESVALSDFRSVARYRISCSSVEQEIEPAPFADSAQPRSVRRVLTHETNLYDERLAIESAVCLDV